MLGVAEGARVRFGEEPKQDAAGLGAGHCGLAATHAGGPSARPQAQRRVLNVGVTRQTSRRASAAASNWPAHLTQLRASAALMSTLS